MENETNEIALTDTEVKTLGDLQGQVNAILVRIGEMVVAVLEACNQVSGTRTRLNQIVGDKIALAGLKAESGVRLDTAGKKLVPVTSAKEVE